MVRGMWRQVKVEFEVRAEIMEVRFCAGTRLRNEADLKRAKQQRNVDTQKLGSVRWVDIFAIL